MNRFPWTKGLWLTLLLSASAAAHDFQPGVVALHEDTPGRFRFKFSDPVASSGIVAPKIEVTFPAGCDRSEGFVTCGDRGLLGDLRIVGMPPSVPLVLSVSRLSGSDEEHVLTGAVIEVQLGSDRPASFGGWVKLGLLHVLAGFDHLAFVVAMVFVARGRRRLLATVSTFTVGHALSLALAVKGLVQLPGPPVEACIAASVVLLAREALVGGDSWTRRWPWAISFGFGLIHGLGFAGALQQTGLPQRAWATALLAFNVGIELAQLAVVGVTLALLAAPFTAWRAQLVPRLALTAIGACGMFWFVERTLALTSP